jgi:hypothetical protein
MLGPPTDAMPIWFGLCLVSVLFLGLAIEVPTAPPPDAAAAATTVDAVAVSEYPTTAAHPTPATAVRVGPKRLALRSDGGTAHATFAYGPVTPAANPDLRRVLRGIPPARVFEDPAAFRVALERSRNRTPAWRPLDGRLLVRRVSWGEVNATLVGA